MKLKIKSLFSCILNIENNEYEINNIYEYIDVLTTKRDILLKVYPTTYDKKYIPYYVKIDLLNIEDKYNFYYKIYKFSCQYYEIELQPYKNNELYNLILQKRLIINKKEYYCNFYSNGEDCNLTINNNKKIFNYKFDYKNISHVNIKQSSEFIFFKICSLNDNYFVCLKIKDDEIVIDESIKAFQINFKKDIITIYGKIFDIVKHGIIIEYNLLNNTKNKKMIYTQDINDIKIDSSLIPYVFFEALTIGNIKLCRKFMSKNLSSKIDNNHLKEYFGSFKKIRYEYRSNEDNIITLEYNTEKKYLIKCIPYRIEMKEGKITNINQL